MCNIGPLYCQFGNCTFTQSEAPKPHFEQPVDQQTPQPKTLATSAVAPGSIPVAALVSSDGTSAFAERVKITERIILDRLKITDLPAEVGLASLKFSEEQLAPDGGSANPAEGTEQALLPDVNEDEHADVETDEDGKAVPLGSAEEDCGTDSQGDPKRRRLSDLPAAILFELNADTAYSSGWAATIQYGRFRYIVDSDIIIPRGVVEEEQPQQTNTLETFDWDEMCPVAMRRVAETALDQAFTMTFDSVRGVRVDEIIGAKPLPRILQVRALQDFKVGELLLTPYSLSSGVLINGQDVAKLKGFTSPDAAQMDATCLPKAPVYIRTKLSSDRRKKSDTDEHKAAVCETFWGISPRFETRARQAAAQKTAGQPKIDDDIASSRSAVDGMSPFWALTRTCTKSKVNMAQEEIVFDIQPMLPIGCKVPSPIKKPLWTATIRAARNVKKIKMGDLLHFSMMEDDDDL